MKTITRIGLLGLGLGMLIVGIGGIANRPTGDAYTQFFKHGDAVAIICNDATFAGQYGYSNNEVLAILDTNGYIVLINKNKITAVALVAGPQTKEGQVSETR